MNRNLYNYCPHCGKICKINDTFCDNCGFQFNSERINKYNQRYSNQYFPRTSSSYITHKQSVFGKIISCMLYGFDILLVLGIIYFIISMAF